MDVIPLAEVPHGTITFPDAAVVYVEVAVDGGGAEVGVDVK